MYCSYIYFDFSSNLLFSSILTFFQSNVMGSIPTELVAFYDVQLGDIGMLGSYALIGFLGGLISTDSLLQRYGIFRTCQINLIVQAIGGACLVFTILLSRNAGLFTTLIFM